jgi:hypothetical protein
MTSRKHKQLQHALAIHCAEAQAMKRAEGSRHPSRWGARRPSCVPADPRRPFLWGARRTSHSGSAWESLRRHLQSPRGPCKGEERRHDPGDLFSPSISLSISSPFPFTYKRGRETIRQGDGTFFQTHIHIRILHQRPGSPVPLSSICNPYCKPSARAQAARTGRMDILPEPV